MSQQNLPAASKQGRKCHGGKWPNIRCIAQMTLCFGKGPNFCFFQHLQQNTVPLTSFFGVERMHHGAIDIIWHHTFFQLSNSMMSHAPLLNGGLPTIVMGGAIGFGVTLLRQQPFPMHQAMSIIDELNIFNWSWWGPSFHL